MVYGSPLVLKVRLLLWEKWVDVSMRIHESLKHFKGDRQQRYRAVALWVSKWRIQCSSPALWNFDFMHAGSEKVQNHQLRADLVWSINYGKLQSRHGDFPGFSCKLLWHYRVRDSVSGRCCYLPHLGELFMSQVDFQRPVLCATFSTNCEVM